MQNKIRRKISLSENTILTLIFILCLALRIFAVLNLPEQHRIPLADAADYDNLAVNLLSGKGFIDPETNLPSSFRMPLYPLFLAFIYLIFGIRNFLAVRLIQCIMGALLSIVVFHIGKILFSKKIGFLAAFLFAFYRPYIFYSFYGGPAFLLSENLFTLLLGAAVLFLVKEFFENFNLKNSIIMGILTALIILTRPIFAPFPLLLFALMVYKKRYSFPVALKKFLPLCITIAIVISPWTIRNCFVNKQFVPFSTEGGFALFSGNNPYVKGGGHTNPQELLPQEQRDKLRKMPEAQRDKALAGFAKEFIFKNYKKIPELSFKKLLVMWDIFGTDYSRAGAPRKYNICYAIVLMFSLVGIARAVMANFNIGSLLLISLFYYFSLFAIIFAGDPRIRYPVEPYLIIFSSAGIFTIYEAFKKKFLAYIAIGSIIGLNFILYLYSDSVLGWIRRQ